MVFSPGATCLVFGSRPALPTGRSAPTAELAPNGVVGDYSRDYKIQDNEFHIAGPSNGDIASFYVASLNPQYFLSITAFPGYLWEATPAHIQAISKMCINMFVGELDPMGWQDLMQKQASEFRAKGMTAQYTVEKGQPHRLGTFAGPNAGRLFDLVEQAKQGCAK